jgi:hypothetical protein
MLATQKENIMFALGRIFQEISPLSKTDTGNI